MHVNSLCACSHSEAMKGSSLCLLILSRLLASPVWAQLTLTDPTWGARSFYLQNGGPFHRVHAHSLAGVQNRRFPSWGWPALVANNLLILFNKQDLLTLVGWLFPPLGVLRFCLVYCSNLAKILYLCLYCLYMYIITIQDHNTKSHYIIILCASIMLERLSNQYQSYYYFWVTINEPSWQHIFNKNLLWNMTEICVGCLFICGLWQWLWERLF
jgi:hypothetical protein